MVKTSYVSESVEIPDGVEVKIEDNNKISVKGPNGGPIVKDFSHARGIEFKIEDKKLKFSSHFPKSKTISLIYTIISIVKNLIIGVQNNYKYFSKVCFIHFPCSVKVDKPKKTILVENFCGERAPRKSKYPDNMDVEVEGDDVTFIGPDKEALGTAAARLQRCCKIKKKDPRVFQDGVYLFKIQIGNEVIWQIK